MGLEPDFFHGLQNWFETIVKQKYDLGRTNSTGRLKLGIVWKYLSLVKILVLLFIEKS